MTFCTTPKVGPNEAYQKKPASDKAAVAILQSSASIESANSIEAIDLLGYKNEIRVERGDCFQIRIDGAADFLFLLRIGRIVAKVSVADEAILHTEGVERFGQAGREGNDARGKLRNADRAAEFVNDFTRCGRRGGRRCGREGLCAERQGAEQEYGDGENAGALHASDRTVLHESPLTKLPREICK